MNTMPEILREIYQEVQRSPLPASSLPEYRTGWNEYIAEARERIPDLMIADNGDTMVFGTCSPGCLACKQGVWDCIFLTTYCNLACPFCYSPSGLQQDSPISAFGSQREQIAKGYGSAGIRGVAFSGGEPFRKPAELLEWVAWARGVLPEGYLWVYTNGALIQPQTLMDLGQAGLDEIRFNVAATGYDRPVNLDVMRRAADYIPAVTIEIPAIPGDSQKILGSLILWERAGVRYLNLHELLYEPGTPGEWMPGERRHVQLPDGHATAFDPGSRELVLLVMEYVKLAGLSLQVNHCSLMNKVRQVRMRRRSLLPITQMPFEKLVGDELLESTILYTDQQYVRVHPDQVADFFSGHSSQRTSGWRAARVVRTAPLSVEDRGRWVVCEIEPGEGF